MNWLFLIISGILEVIAVIGTRMLSQKQYLSGGAISVCGFGIALYFLHLAMRTIDMSVAYAVYTGMGVIGTVFCGIFLWGESRKPIKLVYIGLIVLAIVALKISD